MQKLVKNNSGLTLIELLIAMVVGVIVLAIIYSVFGSQQKIHTKEQQVVDAQQNVRGAAHFIAREIRLAGMDETGVAGAGFLTAGPHSIQFTVNRNDDDNVTGTDEDVTYGFSDEDDTDANGRADAGVAAITRVASNNGTIAEDIHAVGFAYAFDDDGDGQLDFVDGDGDGLLDAGEEIWAYDSDGNGDLDWNNDTSAALATAVGFDSIRAVRIWILARTRNRLRGYTGPKNFIVGDKVINVNDNFQYRLLTTTVKCRNMGI